MKKLLSALLALIIVLSTTVLAVPVSAATKSTVSVWDGSTATGFAKGDGTANNPYEIWTAAELKYLSASLENVGTASDNRFGHHYKLMVNIDLAGQDWVPIGKSGASKNFQWFEGYFDGNGHTVSNFIVREDYAVGGLFGAAGGVIENLKIANATILANTCGGAIAGSLHQGVGSTTGEPMALTIRNCEAAADVTINCDTNGKNGRVGGIIGAVYDDGILTIENCISRATVILKAASASLPCAGGIVGLLRRGNIENCINYGNVTIEIDKKAAVCGGGIVGLTSLASIGYTLTIKNVINYGNVSGKNINADAAASISIGGILGSAGTNKNAGDATSATMENAYSLAPSITASAESGNAYAGEIIGNATGDFMITNATALDLKDVDFVGNKNNESFIVGSGKIASANGKADFEKIEGYNTILVNAAKAIADAEHEYTIPNKDDTHHWNECTCGAVNTKEAHVFGEWTVTGDTRTRTCACGYVQNEAVAPETTKAPETAKAPAVTTKAPVQTPATASPVPMLALTLTGAALLAVCLRKKNTAK